MPSFRCALLGAGLMATILSGPPACADDDLFQLDSGHWMSFDHYKDADKRGTLDKITPPPKIEAPVVADQAAPAPSQTAANSAPVVAPPTRPIDLPVMPGMNKGFSIQVNSTEDGRPDPAPVISPTTEEPDLHLSDKNWQSPSSMQHTANGDANGEDEDTPLNVRMTYLPDSKITPVPSPEHESMQKLAHAALEKGLIRKAKLDSRQAEKTPSEIAANAAIDAYKKQQLDAIQSDRQTLAALQEAIHSLGLEKQLDFMASSNSALNISDKQDVPNADTAAKPTVR